MHARWIAIEDRSNGEDLTRLHKQAGPSADLTDPQCVRPSPIGAGRYQIERNFSLSIRRSRGNLVSEWNGDQRLTGSGRSSRRRAGVVSCAGPSFFGTGVILAPLMGSGVFWKCSWLILGGYLFGSTCARPQAGSRLRRTTEALLGFTKRSQETSGARLLFHIPAHKRERGSVAGLHLFSLCVNAWVLS